MSHTGSSDLCQKPQLRAVVDTGRLDQRKTVGFTATELEQLDQIRADPRLCEALAHAAATPVPPEVGAAAGIPVTLAAVNTISDVVRALTRLGVRRLREKTRETEYAAAAGSGLLSSQEFEELERNADEALLGAAPLKTVQAQSQSALAKAAVAPEVLGQEIASLVAGQTSTGPDVAPSVVAQRLSLALAAAAEDTFREILDSAIRGNLSGASHKEPAPC